MNWWVLLWGVPLMCVALAGVGWMIYTTFVTWNLEADLEQGSSRPSKPFKYEEKVK